VSGGEIQLALFGHGGQLASAIYDLAEPRDLMLSAFSRSDCDITDKVALRNAVDAVRPAVIINAAAYTAVDRAESESERAFAVNRNGAANLAEAAKSVGAALIHVSTDYVFDGSKSGAYTELDPVAPLGVYGRSKAEGESAILEIMPANAVVLRTAWVYGVDGANFVKTMLRLGAEREVVRVVDDQHGSPTFADDLADAILNLAVHLRPARSRIYHATGQGTATWFDFAREIFAETARRGLRTPRLEAITTAQYPTPAKRPANSVLDCSLLKRDFGIALPPWRDGLRRMLDAHLEGVQ
jgi:dTDP-4-dehydrorhamnose reductase